MTDYWIWMISCALVCIAYHLFATTRNRFPPVFVWLFPFAAIVLGYTCSKLLYYALDLTYLSSSVGLSKFFLQVDTYQFSFFGGCLGVVLAGVCCAQIARVPLAEAMDALAPPCVVMVALARFGEFLTPLGYGAYMESFQFFPVSIPNEYGEWFFSVFLLEGLCAMAVYWKIITMRSKAPGDLAVTALFSLALCQVFCESLRATSIRWGFVRGEQVLCALVVLAVILFEHILLLRKRGWTGRFNTLLPGSFFCVFMIGLTEYALDKSDLPRAVCYGFMVFLLILLAKIKSLYSLKSFYSLF